MILINAKDFGIMPEREISEKLTELFSYLKSVKEEKTVVFEKGEYSIDNEKCITEILYITNTTGDEEYKKEETPHLNTVAFYLEGISDLTLDGNGSVFTVNGKATNMSVVNCENIVIKNLEIRHSHPHMHEIKVIGKTLFSVDYEIDEDTLYEFKKGRMYFYGKDYYVPADRNAAVSWWCGLIKKDTPNKVERVRHPFYMKIKIKNTGKRRVRAYYPVTSRFEIGDRFYIYDVRRQYAGIFVDRTKNIILENIKQRFNYSLALVAQDSENIIVDGVEFAPEKNSSRALSSVADFIQICMCRGKTVVRNSFFDGAGDDCINVHGIHFKITDKKENIVTVSFMHPQTHGFNPLREGDEIAFINPETMLETGRTVIRRSELINEREIRLTLDSAETAALGDVIEDISACPDLEFTNNTATRIITRGILVTTRGKVNIESNHFYSTTMSGILLSDDAQSWYESGMCCDVTIKNNVFDYCGETPILIKPENKKHEGAVHKNIKIISNVFRKYDGVCIDVKSSENIVIKNNSFLEGEYLKAENCSDISEE